MSAEDIAAIVERLRELAETHVRSRHVYPTEEGLYQQTHDRAESAFIAAANPPTILALLDALTQAETREKALRAENERLAEAVRILQDTFPKTVAAPMDRAEGGQS